MSFGEIAKPVLTEPGVRYFIDSTLKQCHKVREIYNNYIMNVFLFVTFIFMMGLFLAYKFKGKLTPEEIEHKNDEKKQYIMSKIRNYQDAKQREKQSIITGLPEW